MHTHNAMHTFWELTISIPNDDLGRGIDQVDKLWVGILWGDADREALKLVFKGAVGQDVDTGTRCASSCIEIEEFCIDSTTIDVTVDSTTDCRLGKERGCSVCVCVCV